MMKIIINSEMWLGAILGAGLITVVNIFAILMEFNPFVNIIVSLAIIAAFGLAGLVFIEIKK